MLRPKSSGYSCIAKRVIGLEKSCRAAVISDGPLHRLLYAYFCDRGTHVIDMEDVA